ncbi:MAG: hypothetical protein ACKN92_01505, partial [Candidatus Nanopelagicaceae bacterium]
MKLKKSALLMAAIFVIGSPAVANAKAMVTVNPLTNLQATGQVVHIALANYPANAGFYIQQCLNPDYKKDDWSRPTICNPAAQLWISTSIGANFAPNADILFKPTANFTYAGKTVDCTKSICGVFIRLDHMATADRSEDQFIPLAFAGGVSPTLQSDAIRILINNKQINGDSVIRAHYKDVFTVNATAKSGATLTYASLSTVCSIAGNVVTVQKGGGYCDIAITSPGNAQFSGTTRHLLVKVTPGTQKVTVNGSGTAGSIITLPATSNFGEKVTYTVS